VRPPAWGEGRGEWCIRTPGGAGGRLEPGPVEAAGGGGGVSSPTSSGLVSEGLLLLPHALVSTVSLNPLDS